MKGWDPEGLTGPKNPLPDSVQIRDPPVDKIVSEPSSESREPAAVVAPPPVAEESAPYTQEQPTFQDGGYGGGDTF